MMIEQFYKSLVERLRLANRRIDSAITEGTCLSSATVEVDRIPVEFCISAGLQTADIRWGFAWTISLAKFRGKTTARLAYFGYNQNQVDLFKVQRSLGDIVSLKPTFEPLGKLVTGRDCDIYLSTGDQPHYVECPLLEAA